MSAEISFVLLQSTRVTDGRTDIQTDGRLYDPEYRIAYNAER